MHKHFIILSFGILMVLISCKKRDWNNPFDPDCPKESFTPGNFKAEQQGNVVKLTWTQSNTHISGFKIERKVASGSWVKVASPGKSITTWNDTNLTGGKLHEYRLYAYAGSNLSYIVSAQITPLFTENGNTTGSFNDSRDFKTYNWIKIGNQVWMEDNLAWLPSVSPPINISVTYPYYYVYGNTGSDISAAKNNNNFTTYGVLYNIEAALTACPAGWHLPSDAEWKILTTFLGGESLAGSKIKESGTTHWASPNTDATNESCFNGLPGGMLDIGGYFNGSGYVSYWWSSTETSSGQAWSRYLGSSTMEVGRLSVSKGYGFSVRCIRN